VHSLGAGALDRQSSTAAALAIALMTVDLVELVREVT